MLYATATVIYAVSAFGLRPTLQLIFGGLLLVGLSIVTVLHVQQENSLAHRLCFGSMIVIVAARCIWLLQGIKDATVKSELKHLALVGSGNAAPSSTYWFKNTYTFILVTFVSGFILWLVDVFSCDDLRRLRQIIGVPLGVLLELHSW